ncbi:uncharacterized protein TNCV_1394261 [Trichonephila clavipes]|nr:uncharacterized protein TNCV_1394261 [Trichonephila clavipes]
MGHWSGEVIYISEETYQKYFFYKQVKKSSTQVITAQGAKGRNMGVVELNIGIRDLKKPWLFHVLADLEYPCILGIDFIGGSKIILDFDRKSLVIQESQSRDQLIEEQKTDPKLGHIYRYLENPEDSSVNAAICENGSRDFRLVEGLLFYAKCATSLGESGIGIGNALYTFQNRAALNLSNETSSRWCGVVVRGMPVSERLGTRHVKTVVYRPQANRTERVNRDLVQMIANYVNEQHDTWDQFLREFAYAIRTAVNETTGKTSAELFLGRKLITPFQKLVMVSDGTEFAVGDIERLFEVARRNTEIKHENWKKYYNRRRHDVQIKVNDWVLVATHPLSSATRKVVAKFKPKFEGTGNSDNGSLHDESSGFDKVQRRSNDSRDGKKKGSEVKRELEEKGLSFRNNQREKHTNKTNKRGSLIRSIPSSWSEKDRMNKRERKAEGTVTPTTSGYNLRPRIGKREESRPTIERKAQQGGPVRSRKGRKRNDSPYIKERTDQATRMPDEELINNGKTRKGEERGQRNPYHWRSW